MEKILKITRNTLENIALAAQKTYPMEFIALFGSKQNNYIADELVIVPAVFGSMHSMIYSSLIPFDKKIIGSVHSHPTRHNFPSQADLNSFRKLGKMHIIIAYPFGMENIAAFDNNGKTLQIKIVEQD